jgi:hypothetical protein
LGIRAMKLDALLAAKLSASSITLCGSNIRALDGRAG